MTKQEYESLQQALSTLLNNERLRRKGLSGREKDGYEMGVRACKSVLSNYSPRKEVEV